MRFSTKFFDVYSVLLYLHVLLCNNGVHDFLIDSVWFYTTYRQYFSPLTATTINKRWSVVKSWTFSGDPRESTLHRNQGVVIFDTGHHLTPNPTDIRWCNIPISSHLTRSTYLLIHEYDSPLWNKVELTQTLGMIDSLELHFVCMYVCIKITIHR